MKIYISILFIGLSLISQAQNKISGIVTNSQNEPIMGVEIYAEDLNKGTSTNEEGYYELTNLPTTKIKLTAAFIGYQTETKLITIQNNETEINFVLEEAVFKMDEIIISTAFNKLQSQNVMKVDHESISSLQKKGVATLIEGLTTIPGVSQISTGVSIGKPMIRGLSGNRVLVYSQGVRIENQQFGDEHGLGLNDAGIESVEVIKGPASLLYGSDALGGVLYFIPEKFAEANSIKTDFTQKLFSNTLGSNSSIGVKTSSNNWKFLVRGTYNTQSDYKIPNGDRITNTRFNETDFKTGIGYQNSKFSSVVRYNFNKLDIGIPEDGVSEQTTSKKTIFPKQEVNNHLLSLNNIFFFENSKVAVDLGYISNERSEFEDSNEAALHMKLNTLNYNTKYTLPKLGNIETIVGLQGMHQTNDNYGEEYLIPNAITNDIGLYGTANYEWEMNVLQAGIRFDNRNISSEENGIFGEEGYFEKLNKSYNSFNASLGYKSSLSDRLLLRVNVASGFRAPNLAELTSNGVHEGTNRYEIGNSDLKTEQNVQTDVNFEYNSKHFEFFINGFYNHINNYIYTSPSGTQIEDNAVFNYVQNEAKLYGGEMGIHLHPHPLDWLHFESNFETVTGKKQNGDYLPLIPANNWNNTIRLEFDNKWLAEGFASLNVSSTFNQNNVSGFETASNGYTLVNIGIGGKIQINKTTFDISLNGNNIFDKSYISHLSRLKVDEINNIGSNFSASIKFNI
ncbi:MAG: TonB-dependent receptor [Lutibacter sp.]|uniref:TonB-dependent receptor n=1 Tax=Lutibacter sp. TaxID=1925666 RepID=UPI001828689A|nr:TonB-dependent receptor [Lutibacter sp.]MBT8317195.1 TonB-dependent receptor [Lutibacter sp.]NNJ58054.1 TonB-dependent receptor [Lutibacter sp.]